MPLKEGSSKKTISENIKTEKEAHPNMSTAQAVAIAYNVAHTSQAHSHKKHEKKEKK